MLFCGATATQNYGFVAFKSEIERDRVVGKRVTIHGKQAKIVRDTREHRKTTGVMDEIWVSSHNFTRSLRHFPVLDSYLQRIGTPVHWRSASYCGVLGETQLCSALIIHGVCMQAAYSRFARVSLCALDNEQVEIPPDPEVEADIVTSDPAAHEAVRHELRRVCNQMAIAYREQSTEDNSFFERMDEIKHQVKLKLVTLHGLQRCCRQLHFSRKKQQRLTFRAVAVKDFVVCSKLVFVVYLLAT